MAFLNFDSTQVAPTAAIEVIPAGKYNACIVESEIKPTKNGGGQILNLTWQIIDGQYANRKVFDRVNIANANPQAQEIGQRQLSSLCHTLGVLKLQDSVQLHNKVCSIRVVITIDKTGQYDDRNEVKGYSPQQAAAPQVFVTPAASAPTPAVAAPKAVAPWL